MSKPNIRWTIDGFNMGKMEVAAIRPSTAWCGVEIITPEAYIQIRVAKGGRTRIYVARNDLTENMNLLQRYDSRMEEEP